ncbi:substrate-binding domain-containing protein [Nonomuraea gerenzanensis]|uniref:von Willebrand factor, type A n=1 Tax=Nonomuraea gerenzanensis TaxID=93944 RepID=A0A1M4E0T1_9ACTN|nr:substrate-binding domain-containing protein [Nonomuraea gerenzanensis]UBU14696.1 substrate-binding and VWA domain-containing protein [Nonomuraea gerenzanensis]SBO92419.1 von Willebrand factor, type A [Nonomuraea gerenzanensis]
MRLGRHRAALAPEQRRRKAFQRGMLAGLTAVAIVAAGLVVIFGGGGVLCSTREPVLVNVAAAVDVAPAVMEAAGRFNETRTAVSGRCVLVQVTEQPPATVLRTLIGDRAGVLAERPDGWIADSSAWIRLARQQGASSLPAGESVVATSPLVFATRSSLAQRFSVGRTEMNWRMVFPSTVRGRLTPNADEPDVVRVPDPSLAGAGIATVAAARDVVGTGPDADKALTAFVRWAQAGSAPDYRSMLAAVDDHTFWRRPVVIVPEQSVWNHNLRPSSDPVVALHPREGTINLDYPYVVTAADPDVAEASTVFAGWLKGAQAQEIVRRAGFRSGDGTQGPISPGPQIPSAAPRTRSSVSPQDIDEALRAWSRLAPPTNILVLADTSKHMAEPLNGRTRVSVALDAAKIGLQLFPDSTHMGLWEFADKVGGIKSYRQHVGLGPITEPETGQVIRRSRLDQLTSTIAAHPKRDSSLYDAILGGFRTMSSGYREEMNNALLVITAGRDDGTGTDLGALLDRLKREWNPDRPVQIIVIAFGEGVDRAALSQITAVTNGSLHEAEQPGEIIDVFLAALARRLCHPTCKPTA